MACLHLVERKKERPGEDGAWRTVLKIQRLAEAPHRNQVLLTVLGTWRPHSARFLLQHNSCCLFWKEHGIFQRAVCLQVSWPLASWRGICTPLCSHSMGKGRGRHPFMLPSNGEGEGKEPFHAPTQWSCVFCEKSQVAWNPTFLSQSRSVRTQSLSHALCSLRLLSTGWTAAALQLLSHDMILVLFVTLLNDESKEFRVSDNADQSRTE